MRDHHEQQGSRIQCAKGQKLQLKMVNLIPQSRGFSYT